MEVERFGAEQEGPYSGQGRALRRPHHGFPGQLSAGAMHESDEGPWQVVVF